MRIILVLPEYDPTNIRLSYPCDLEPGTYSINQVE